MELDLEWPSELTLFELKNYILSELIKYGKPLRWAITSVTNYSANKKQILSVEVVYIVNEDKGESINTFMN